MKIGAGGVMLSFVRRARWFLVTLRRVMQNRDPFLRGKLSAERQLDHKIGLPATAAKKPVSVLEGHLQRDLMTIETSNPPSRQATMMSKR